MGIKHEKRINFRIMIEAWGCLLTWFFGLFCVSSLLVYELTTHSTHSKDLTPTPTPIVEQLPHELIPPQLPSLPQTPPTPQTPQTPQTPPTPQTPQTLPTPSLICVVIDGKNPPGVQGDGLAPTASSALRELKLVNPEAKKLYFYDRAGPDATGEETVLEAPNKLPRIVHNGDQFCVKNVEK